LPAPVAVAALLVAALVARSAHAADPLPSWNDGAAKQAIVRFVGEATRTGGPGFVPPAERIAVFDNDGTLWAEQPIYVQAAFAFDRVKALAPEHPEWREKEPFRSLLAGDTQGALAGGEPAIVEIVMATHAGTTTDEFAAVVRAWLASARHPRFQRPYTKLVYAPMLELLSYLRWNGFATYIVSGGGADFVRVFSESVYRIPPQRVVGSTIATEFRLGPGGAPQLVRLPKIDFVDDKAGKPVGIHRFIGRRPVFAFGNSDGDLQMLQWTAAGARPSFLGVVHHTDAEREWAYDRESPVGRLDAALDEARAKGWTVVDMKRDWKRVFAFE
jgi:phosphoglycolate phosphatase-like HAD superfamily hydrolase